MTTPRRLGLTLLSVGLALAATTIACKPAGISDDTGQLTGDGDGDSTGDDNPTGDGDGDPTGDGDGDGDGGPGCASALDILLVVDNSATMGEVQPRLATSMSALIDPLDAAGVDWRIGITTTDSGNVWCPPGVTTPESGNLVLSSCKSRIGDFIFNNGEIDVTDLACNNICDLTSDALDVIPTPTEADPNPSPRPWIERIDGASNLPNGTDPAAALGCLVPMGVNGCGFEQQLESSYLALLRAVDVSEDNSGFLRSDASLLVIIVSDEVDCSHNKAWAQIFEQDGNKVFWSDPDAAFPTSAVCWNAGVQCVGDPSGYTSCDPADHDIDGNIGASDADAVLHPISRYDDLLAGLETQLQAVNPSAVTQLSVIGGAAPDGSLAYADSLDPVVQGSFGIGFGCTTGDQTLRGLPPVRMRDVSAHSGGQIQSICANDYTAALAKLVEPFTAACP